MNYDNLSDFTVFVMASWCIMDQKKGILYNILQNICTVPCITFTFAIPFKEIYGFVINEWNGACQDNVELVKSMVFTQSKIRPFGAWFEKTINVPYVHASLFGIFSVWKPRIMRHSRETYKKWLDEICENGANPEIGHYWERSWLSVFTPPLQT